MCKTILLYIFRVAESKQFTSIIIDKDAAAARYTCIMLYIYEPGPRLAISQSVALRTPSSKSKHKRFSDRNRISTRNVFAVETGRAKKKTSRHGVAIDHIVKCLYYNIIQRRSVTFFFFGHASETSKTFARNCQ